MPQPPWKRIPGMTDNKDLSEAQKEAWCNLVEIMVLEGHEAVLTVLKDFDLYKTEYLTRRAVTSQFFATK